VGGKREKACLHRGPKKTPKGGGRLRGDAGSKKNPIKCFYLKEGAKSSKRVWGGSWH